jgi:AcrR family transcriptional regulator
LKAARKLFGERGFAATSVDDIASASRVAKGAIYHYFKTKNDLFEAVFEQASADLVTEIDGAVRSEKDTLAMLSAGTELYFTKCAREPTGQIILRDGPAVLGWQRWREIDAKHFGGKIPRALNIAMDAGIIARQPVEPLARLLLGAISEAAAASAGRSDIEAAGHEYARAFRSLLDALRRR